MIGKEKGEFYIECADCGHREYGGTMEKFTHFWERKKEEGWTALKVDEQWEHHCPSCVSQ